MNQSPPAKVEISESGKLELTSEELIDRLKKALGKEGDFPASAKVVTELRQLTSDPSTSANQVTEVILREPSLGMRVLHLVNSSFYNRGAPIMTVSQAVMRIGMKPLADLCSGLVLLQKFVPASRRGGAFAGCLRRMVMTSLLASSITSEAGKAQPGTKNSECGYLAGTLSEIGLLLLAYYFPQVYEGALKRSEMKRQDIGKSIFEITGITPLKLSLEILNALHLPDFYKDILTASEHVGSGPSTAPKGFSPQQNDIQLAARGLRAAQNISEAVSSGKSKKEIDLVLAGISSKLKFDDKLVRGVLADLPKIFESHCSVIEVDLPPLPEFVAAYAEGEPSASADKKEEKGEEDPFKQFVEEIRQAVNNREPTASIITTVMETLTWGLKFDRVILLLVNPSKTSLLGRMMLGKLEGIDPKKVSRPLGTHANPKACEVVAFRDSRPVFNGIPVFENGWPLAAMPIGSGSKAIGVIYADRIGGNQEELTGREQAAIAVLVEQLDRSINIHS